MSRKVKISHSPVAENNADPLSRLADVLDQLATAAVAVNNADPDQSSSAVQRFYAAKLTVFGSGTESSDPTEVLVAAAKAKLKKIVMDMPEGEAWIDAAAGHLARYRSPVYIPTARIWTDSVSEQGVDGGCQDRNGCSPEQSGEPSENDLNIAIDWARETMLWDNRNHENAQKLATILREIAASGKTPTAEAQSITLVDVEVHAPCDMSGPLRGVNEPDHLL
jgi:hypothetical protein